MRIMTIITILMMTYNVNAWTGVSKDKCINFDNSINKECEAKINKRLLSKFNRYVSIHPAAEEFRTTVLAEKVTTFMPLDLVTLSLGEPISDKFEVLQRASKNRKLIIMQQLVYADKIIYLKGGVVVDIILRGSSSQSVSKGA